VPRSWLSDLEQRLASGPEANVLAEALVVLAAAAGKEIELDEDEVRAATRRSALLLTAGGDPLRGLDLRGRAVESLSADLDDAARRASLTRGLTALREEAVGLPHLSEAVHALLEDGETAWRAYACSLLAEALAGD
jgi:hypothetical protein